MDDDDIKVNARDLRKTAVNVAACYRAILRQYGITGIDCELNWCTIDGGSNLVKCWDTELHQSSLRCFCHLVQTASETMYLNSGRRFRRSLVILMCDSDL